MVISTITSKNQTTVPKEIRDRLRLGPGDTLRWDVLGKEVRISSERPAFFALRGSIKVGRGSVVADIRRARRLRGLEKW